MIGTFLVLSHFLLRRLGIAPINQSMGCESICLTHEGGARPPGTPGGATRTARQPGGTDEPPSSASGRSINDPPTFDRSEGACDLGLGTMTGLDSHDANAVTAFDFRPLVDTSEAIPLIGFDFETIVDSRSTSLAELGSSQCEYLDEDDTICQQLYPAPIISKSGGGGGGAFHVFQPVAIDSVDDMSVTNTKTQEVVESRDLPASGDGTKTPVDIGLAQGQGKEVPANGLDEVIAAILGLDEVKVGDSERSQPLKCDLTNTVDDAYERMKTCMKNAVSKGEPEAMAMNGGEPVTPKMVIQVPTQECSDQDNLLYLDKCLKNSF